jgi:hypothetical protein
VRSIQLHTYQLSDLTRIDKDVDPQLQIEHFELRFDNNELLTPEIEIGADVASVITLTS